jgi:uncharacterized protein
MDKKPYVIITGASGGLGTAFTLECASRGFNLFLISLPNEDLQSLCHFVKRNYSVEIISLELDLTDKHAANLIVAEIHKQEIEVFMLINNAGLGQNDFFEETEDNYLRKIIELNCISYVMLTKALIPELKKQKRSYIINVGSLGGFFFLPRKSVYAASKGFVLQYSKALRIEIKKYGISLSVLSPGPIITNVDKYLLLREMNWFFRKMLIQPKIIVRKAITKSMKGKELIVPGIFNKFMHIISRIVPDIIMKSVLSFSMRHVKLNDEITRQKVLYIPKARNGHSVNGHDTNLHSNGAGEMSKKVMPLHED